MALSDELNIFVYHWIIHIKEVIYIKKVKDSLDFVSNNVTTSFH